jgi:hypothetical protein
VQGDQACWGADSPMVGAATPAGSGSCPQLQLGPPQTCSSDTSLDVYVIRAPPAQHKVIGGAGMPDVCGLDTLQRPPLQQAQHQALPGATAGATATGAASSSGAISVAIPSAAVSKAVAVVQTQQPGLFPDDLHLIWDAADAFDAQQQGLANKRRLLGFYGNRQVKLSPPDGRCLTAPSDEESSRLILAACASLSTQVWVLPEPGGELRMLLAADLGKGWHDHDDIEVGWGDEGGWGGLGDHWPAWGCNTCCSGVLWYTVVGTHRPAGGMAAGSQLHPNCDLPPGACACNSMACCFV